jgi:pyridoxamine 5'-phosphate oxidase
MPDFATASLDAFREAAFGLLAHAADEPSHPLHIISLATLAPDGAPRLRGVVLRAFVPPERLLLIHADQRSAKTGEIGRDPRCAILGYDPDARLQLRLEGTALVHHQDAAARAAWQQVSPGSRQIYRITPESGRAVADEADIDPHGLAEAEAFRNFALIRFTFRRADILFLGNDRHRRAQSVWQDGAMHSTWIVP